MYGYNEIFLDLGHGGSDGLHGYVPSLDHVVADTVSLCSLKFPYSPTKCRLVTD